MSVDEGGPAIVCKSCGGLPIIVNSDHPCGDCGDTHLVTLRCDCDAFGHIDQYYLPDDWSFQEGRDE